MTAASEATDAIEPAGRGVVYESGSHGREGDPRDARIAELVAAEERLRAIIDVAADAIVSTDEAFRITLFNASAERTFGYAAHEVLGHPLDVLLPDSARDVHGVHVRQFAATGAGSRILNERGRIRGRRRNGELFPVEASISRIRAGGATQYTAILRDVTQQRRAEEEREGLFAREHEARGAAERAERRSAFLAKASELLHSSLDYTATFRTLLEYIVPELATYCVVDVTSDGGDVRRLHVVHADPARQALADRLYAYPRNQSAYMTRHAILYGQAELIVHATDELLRSRAEDAEHFAIIRELGPRSLMIVPLRSRQHVLGAIFFARDATAPPYTQEDLALALELAHRAAGALDNAQLYDHAQRAIRARDDVLGVVSHDLRNPLTVISMCASSLLTHGFADEPRSRDALRTVQQSAQWAQRLIQDLLDVSTIEAGGLSLALQAEDPVVLVTRAAILFEELAVEHGVSLDVDVPEMLPSVRADADRILQALGNLLANAIKFTPAGGRVVIGAAHEQGGVRLFVDDGGPGIPEADVPHIFGRFWTAPRASHVRGTGMGLAIVRGIVDAHGGRVWVEKGARDGARFNVMLPALPAR